MLLKKVWDSVISNTSSSSSFSISRCSSNNNRNYSSSHSIGDFDLLPSEILRLILQKLSPKDAAKLCLVCKTLKQIVNCDDELWIFYFQNSNCLNISQFWDWNSVFFAEYQLNSSFPHVYDRQLYVMDIIGLRAKVPGAIIVDGGSGYCKFGWSKYQGPSGRSATFMEFGNIEAPMYSRLHHFYHTIYGRMQVKSTNQPIVVSIPVCYNDNTDCAKASRKQLKGAIYSALCDMNVPAVCAINQATLALYAARRTSGIVVNIGFNQTSVVPILNGKIMRTVGVEIVGMGALKLTGFLREKLQQQNISFESFYTVRELKENLCFVAFDYEAELSKDTVRSYEVRREGVFTLSKECFQTGEILFQPRMANVRAMALHQAVALCMDHCYAAELMADDSWFKTVVLCGGTACLPGLAERLEKELRELLPLSLSDGIKVIPPPYGVDSAWHGARLISNLRNFPGAWCMTRRQLKEKLRRNRVR